MTAEQSPTNEPHGEKNRESSHPAMSQQRRRLRQCLIDLEESLARPTPGRLAAWVLEVHRSASALGEAFAAHIEFTERLDGGFFDELTTTAPRLVNAVDGMRAEHRSIADEIAALIASLDGGVGNDEIGWAASRRTAATAVMGAVTQHRQKGADLTYEAFNVDIGQSG